MKKLVASLARAGLTKLAAVAPPSGEATADLEQQRQHQHQQQKQKQQRPRQRSEEDRRRLAIVGTGHETLIPTNDKLLAFQTLTGFDTAPVLLSAGHTGRAAPNIGLHARVVSAEKEAGARYRRYHLLINFCLGAQIVVGAALTALGAAKGSRRAITAFAAINTIMAAILTYLKGSGLPDRYGTQEHGWRRVREHMEQREREFGIRDCPLSVEDEVAAIEDMFNRMRSEAENNAPRGGHHQCQCQCQCQSQSQQPQMGRRRRSSAWQGEPIARPPRTLRPRGNVDWERGSGEEEWQDEQEKEEEEAHKGTMEAGLKGPGDGAVGIPIPADQPRGKPEEA